MFQNLVPHLQDQLVSHHNTYKSRCKGVQWEEICANALINAGIGSDWEPDENHKVGVDQTTNCGRLISNKGGTWDSGLSKLKFSGSRLTSHKTLEDKLIFLSKKSEDYIFCLASDPKTAKNYSNPYVYYFTVIDTSKLDYQNAVWETKINTNTGKVSSYKGIGAGYTATISRSMSDQIWTTVDRSLVTELYEIRV